MKPKLNPQKIIRPLLKRNPDTHKNDYGHLLVISGSLGLSGAPVLCSTAALRSGAGLVSVVVPRSVYFQTSSRSLEAMVYPVAETAQGGTISPSASNMIGILMKRATVLAIGPGMGRHPRTDGLIQKVVLQSDVPVVIDADAINAFAGNSRMLKNTRAPLILTPHPGEMARLLGIPTEAVERDRKAVALRAAKTLGQCIVLKSHQTLVADPSGNLYRNTTGNPGMATAGAGDVLTGIIAALIGQGLLPFEAAVAGVYLHGLAGDIAAEQVGQISLIAGDIINALPAAFHSR